MIRSERFRLRLLPIALAQAVGFACGVAGVRIATGMVDAADYGIYGVFLSLAPLGMWVVHAGLIKYVNRHWADSANRRSLWQQTMQSGARKLPWLALSCGVAALLVPWPDPLLTGGLLFVAATLLSLVAAIQAALQASRHHWLDFGITAVGSMTRTFGPLALYALAGASLAALQCGFVLHAALTAGFAWCLFRSDAERHGAGQVELPAIYEGYTFVLLSAANWATIGVNRWIVLGAHGAETAGYFTLAGNLALIATSMLGVVFVQYFQPGFFALADRPGFDRVALARRVDLVALGYGAVAMLGVFAIHHGAEHLMGILVHERYRPALPMIGPAGCFAVAVGTGQFFHSMLLAGRNEAACLPTDLITFAVLVAGGAAATAHSLDWFVRWLWLSPLVPWLVTRTLARAYFFRPAGNPAP